VTKTDVYQDFDQFRRKAGIEEWAAKFVDRKYAFEDKTIQKGESEWMKVVYGFDGETFLARFPASDSLIVGRARIAARLERRDV
jgi:DNA polymerase alpha subunit A